MMDLDLLDKICSTPGTSGYEKRIRDLVIELATPLCDELEVDAMGNVMAIKRGKKDQRVMAAAHMDEIGFIVTHVDEEGFIRFVYISW